MRYRIGIDPGDRFIGIAVVGIDDNDVAVPVHLAVVDLKGDPHQTDIRKLVQARAEHRRARRTRKAHRQRIAKIRALLQGIPADQANRVIALCRRRGWYPDAARKDTSSWQESLAEQEAAAVVEVEEDVRRQPSDRVEGADNASENSMAEIRIPRQEVLEALRRLIPKAAPDLSADTVEKILDILDQRSPIKINNRRVGICGMANCKSRRARAADYPVLWVAEAVLNHLQPRDREEARRFFLQQLAAAGWDLRSGSYAAFRCQSTSRKERAFRAVREAWYATKRTCTLPDTIVKNLDRVIDNMGDRLRQAIRGGSSGRLSMCPQHWFERVKALATREVPPQALDKQSGHSVVWEAVEAKIASYLRYRVLPRLPSDAKIDCVVVERAAFDLMGGPPKEKRLRDVANEIRWRGPYGQLSFLVPDESSDPAKLLAAETGNLCVICGEPLGEQIDRAHLIPQELVGGYPYLAIVAAHPTCNTQQGKEILRVHPRAVEAMEKVGQKIKRKHHVVHQWFNAKLGILKALASFSEEKGRPPVLKYIQRAFATPAATMQGSDRLGKAIRRAVMDANKGEPEVVRRAATEVARARQIAVSMDSGVGEAEPWFVKEIDKESGSILNHAIDAFVVASLPPAQPILSRYGDKAYLWEIPPARIVNRLAILQSREAWDQATQNVWYPAPEKSINVMSLTMRRVWRQAYINDTRIRQRQGGGAYRQPAQTWLDGLKKNHRKDLEGYISNLQFAPLRTVALKALKEAQPEDNVKAVRAAVVRFLKQQTLAGLAGAQPAPTDEHPVRKARIEVLRRWAETDDINQPVPPWVGVTLKEDRRGGAEKQRIRVLQGFHNLWNFAMTLFLVAVHREAKVTLFKVEPDGGLSYMCGRICHLDAEPLRQSIPVKPITPLAPDVKAWRRTATNMLREAGYVRAWLISRGSILKTSDGQEILVETQSADVKVRKLKDVVGVLPGRGWLLFQEEQADQRAN